VPAPRARRIICTSTWIEGECNVTNEDFLRAKPFPDAICNAFYYVDMHSEQVGCQVQLLQDDALVPKLPMGRLSPKGRSRVTVAGRILSAERTGCAGIRARCACMVMGQAMGAAAALGVHRGVPSREVDSGDIVAVTPEHGAAAI
jgi:hypothetical protein